ncbi:hypothetical protein AZI86_14755 [Bdellovibrio bacteriovorus]|uniref:Uncharacterized protein n=1 Tax=Bdellovibrio bacteriovorus TaxID=959 RepID=A0A150WKK0_BDEBC|nr:hypothetical protein [Bdellovibrio bacteriovorus]KYG64061.1 hypothetical protein AZI86_14755 [Bdellovibrio bacteriovorus]
MIPRSVAGTLIVVIVGIGIVTGTLAGRGRTNREPSDYALTFVILAVLGTILYLAKDRGEK